MPERVVLDEVQHVPELFTSLKASIDRNRKPGRMILTGSANVLLLPKLADSLVGRMEILKLEPLAQVEIERQKPKAHFLDRLFAGKFTIKAEPNINNDLIDRILTGGFPAALARTSRRRRREWQAQYVTTLTQRDVREFAKIRSLDAVQQKNASNVELYFTTATSRSRSAISYLQCRIRRCGVSICEAASL
ncbi:MAG: AAA family ATPase [Planctomycetota bacterium]